MELGINYLELRDRNGKRKGNGIGERRRIIKEDIRREMRGVLEEDLGKEFKENTGEFLIDGLDSMNRGTTRVRTRDSRMIFENLTWLTAIEAAEYLRLPSVGALRVLVCKRRIPFHKLGRSLRFRKSELDRLLEVSRNGEY